MAIIDESHPDAMRMAIEAIRNGEVISLPTETIFGLCVEGANSEAHKHLFALKKREKNKPISIAISDDANIADWIELTPKQQSFVSTFLPGPLTVVARARRTDFIFSLNGTVGIRVPQHRFTQKLLKSLPCRSLALTSANVSGEPALSDVYSIQNLWGDRLSLIVAPSSNDSMCGQASTVMSFVDDVPHILRAGAVSESDLMSKWTIL